MKGGRLIKVCGMTQAENIRDVEALGVDLIGHIFYPPSPRFAKELPQYLSVDAGRVGVFVDEPLEHILEKDADWHFTHVQLHGNESPDLCNTLRERGFTVLKALSIGREDRRIAVGDYVGACDMFVFDTKSPGVGGSGKSFDWSLLDSYAYDTPFLLSGGIGPESADALRRLEHPQLAGYDLNSRFETAPGVKDALLLKNFLEQL